MSTVRSFFAIRNYGDRPVQFQISSSLPETIFPPLEIAEITLRSSSTRNSISPNLIDDIFPVPVGGKGMSHFRGEQGRG